MSKSYMPYVYPGAKGAGRRNNLRVPVGVAPRHSLDKLNTNNDLQKYRKRKKKGKKKEIEDATQVTGCIALSRNNEKRAMEQL